MYLCSYIILHCRSLCHLCLVLLAVKCLRRPSSWRLMSCCDQWVVVHGKMTPGKRICLLQCTLCFALKAITLLRHMYTHHMHKCMCCWQAFDSKLKNVYCFTRSIPLATLVLATKLCREWKSRKWGILWWRWTNGAPWHTYAHTCAHTHAQTHAHTHKHMHTHKKHMHTHVHIQTHTSTQNQLTK